MAQYQITAIRKPDVLSRAEHITHVLVPAYSGAPISVQTVISMIRRGHSFFVDVGIYRSSVQVFYRSMALPASIRTRPDDSVLDNLLSLPQC